MAKKLTLDDCVFLCMRNGENWTYWDLQKVIKEKSGTFYNENSISAATRNMRKHRCRVKYGLPLTGEVLIKTKRPTGKGHNYRLITNKE